MDAKRHGLYDDIGYWINRLRAEVHAGFEARLEAAGVTVAQWCILAALDAGDAESVAELSAFIAVDKATISRVAARLAQRSA